MGVVSKGLNNEFETAKVNEPSVFEPLKFYCTCNATVCKGGLKRLFMIFQAFSPIFQWTHTAKSRSSNRSCSILYRNICLVPIQNFDQGLHSLHKINEYFSLK